jgi:hypothetical protein
VLGRRDAKHDSAACPDPTTAGLARLVAAGDEIATTQQAYRLTSALSAHP